jgi:AcrR family transcriptional regulator
MSEGKGAARAAHSREQILDAAETLMSERGYSATFISDVCSASGLPVGSIYWHFRSKFGLLAAVMERGNLRFFEELPRPEDFEGTVRERFDAWFRSNAKLLTARPSFLRLHLLLGLQENVEDNVRSVNLRVHARAKLRLYEALYPLVEEANVSDPEDFTSHLAAYMLATVDGVMLGLQFSESLDAESLLETLRVTLLSTIERASSGVGGPDRVGISDGHE